MIPMTTAAWHTWPLIPSVTALRKYANRHRAVCLIGLPLIKHLPAARPEKGSWVPGENLGSVADHPSTSNPPHLSLCTSVCKSSLSLCAPERLLELLWRPWLWQRTRHGHILCQCRQFGSEAHIHGLPSVCGPLASLLCPWVALTHRSDSLYMTPHSNGGSQSGPNWDQTHLLIPASRPQPCRGG